MMTALPTARPAYGLKGPSAGRTVDNATPQGSTYLRGNSVQSKGAGSLGAQPRWVERRETEGRSTKQIMDIIARIVKSKMSADRGVGIFSSYDVFWFRVLCNQYLKSYLDQTRGTLTNDSLPATRWKNTAICAVGISAPLSFEK
jgi:hypothetical protein